MIELIGLKVFLFVYMIWTNSEAKKDIALNVIFAVTVINLILGLWTTSKFL